MLIQKQTLKKIGIFKEIQFAQTIYKKSNNKGRSIYK